MIRISDTESKFALALQEYLFYLEMLSLSGELTVAIKNGLRKSAKKALSDSEQLKHILIKATNFDEGKEIYNTFQTLAKSADEVVAMVAKTGKIKYGNSLASRLALAFRRTLKKVDHSGNIAIFEYVDNARKLQIQIFTSVDKQKDWEKLGFYEKPHAIQIGVGWLIDNNIKFEKVRSIYSELAPCVEDGYNCKRLLNDLFPQSNIEHSYSFTISKASQKSIIQRKKDINNMLKK
ncbi:MAG TPA: hypothetical protein EYG92_01535 [Lutibacter sp.]|nr:hypothetical protein [Lutibacter sp.]